METIPVRQTVSKREKGLSVPDAAMLIKLAEVWDVPVSKLLGSEIETEEKSDTLAEQFSSINSKCFLRSSFKIQHRRLFALFVLNCRRKPDAFGSNCDDGI